MAGPVVVLVLLLVFGLSAIFSGKPEADKPKPIQQTAKPTPQAQPAKPAQKAATKPAQPAAAKPDALDASLGQKDVPAACALIAKAGAHAPADAKAKAHAALAAWLDTLNKPPQALPKEAADALAKAAGFVATAQAKGWTEPTSDVLAWKPAGVPVHPKCFLLMLAGRASIEAGAFELGKEAFRRVDELIGDGADGVPRSAALDKYLNAQTGPTPPTDMVYIPSGLVQLGVSHDEARKHKVAMDQVESKLGMYRLAFVRGFFIEKHEVSVKDWNLACMQLGTLKGRYIKGMPLPSPVCGAFIPGMGDELSARKKLAELYGDFARYYRKGSLPTSAQWHRALKGSQPYLDWWVSNRPQLTKGREQGFNVGLIDADKIADALWPVDHEQDETAGDQLADSTGILHMVGNVYELTVDECAPHWSTPILGGSFNESIELDGAFINLFLIDRTLLLTTWKRLGFRCVRDAGLAE